MSRGGPQAPRGKSNRQQTSGTSKEAYIQGLAAEVSRACDAWLRARGIKAKFNPPPPPGHQEAEADGQEGLTIGET